MDTGGDHEICKDDVRTGYTVAARMAVHAARVTWNTIAAFVGFNTAILTVAVSPLGLSGDASGVSRVAAIVLSLTGLVGAVALWFVHRRASKYFRYWILSARELEKKLDPFVQTFERWKRFSDGCSVTVDNEPLQSFTPYISRVMTVVFSFFVIAYLIVLGVHICGATSLYLKHEKQRKEEPQKKEPAQESRHEEDVCAGDFCYGPTFAVKNPPIIPSTIAMNTITTTCSIEIQLILSPPCLHLPPPRRQGGEL